MRHRRFANEVSANPTYASGVRRALYFLLLGCSNGASAPDDVGGADVGAIDVDVRAEVAGDVGADVSPDVVLETDVRDGSAPPLLSDDFEAHPLATAWLDGTTHGAWRAQSNGFGQTVVTTDGTRVLRETPRASVMLDETHANLVLSTATIAVDFDLTLRMKTVKQLRTPTPNAWEVAWIIWHYRDAGHFYYFTPKPNGWELAKVDNTKANPSGAECAWPAYANCKYPGAQRYLATGTAEAFPTGAWYRVHVRQVASKLTVLMDDKEIATFTDTDAPYTSGAIGLYNEDADVEFDDVLVTPAK